jgi:predicted CXXCH cytochrome family protein
MLKYCTLISFFILFFFFSSVSSAQEEDDVCFDCHGDRTFIVEKEGKEVSLFVNRAKYKNSIHAENGCTSCHFDVDPDDLPHAEGLEKVDCSFCHDEPAEKYAESLHGQAKDRGMRLAPSCITCHGQHDILPSDNENSKTYVMNVPNLCGTCHKEGTPVSKILNINQSKILENYSQSIHGDGLFRRGLIVTAVCTSCHNAHDILPHQNPKSSINRSNIPSTCMQCHSQIEKVHTKVIRGELWEKEPHELPICIDCHQPHKVRRVFYDESFPDKLCMSCHSNKDLYKEENGKKISLYVDYDEHSTSVHGKNSCYKCHTNISNSKNPVCKNSGKVDCSMCHSEESENYAMSTHGTLQAEGKPAAPYCTDCHGTHNMKAKDDVESPIFSRNIPDLCGKCHKEGEKAAKLYTGKDHEIVKNYTMSIHGKGLLQSGLMVTATCIDCHTSHRELPEKDPRSTVNPNNIATTCAKCHLGIYEDFKTLPV